MRPVNLLPQDLRRRSSGDGGNGAYIALGVLAVLLAMMAGWVLTSNKVTDAKNRAATARVQADQLEAQATSKETFVDFSAIKEQRLVSVGSVAATRFDWERFMHELSRVLPERGWLQSADASTLGEAGAAPAGGVVDPLAPAAQPTATLVGCMPNQPDVARLMVRLRDLHRVEDVQLKESSRGESADETSLDNCGPLFKFEVLVTFGVTPPADEAPKGATSVPTSLGGGQ